MDSYERGMGETALAGQYTGNGARDPPAAQHRAALFRRYLLHRFKVNSGE